jgi:hypothetical protein
LISASNITESVVAENVVNGIVGGAAKAPVAPKRHRAITAARGIVRRLIFILLALGE